MNIYIACALTHDRENNSPHMRRLFTIWGADCAMLVVTKLLMRF